MCFQHKNNIEDEEENMRNMNVLHGSEGGGGKREFHSLHFKSEQSFFSFFRVLSAKVIFGWKGWMEKFLLCTQKYAFLTLLHS